MNDFSARDIQFQEMACRLGPAKGKDFATAIGPCLVTPDEISDLNALTMIARVNGEVWSQGRFGTIHWSFPQMIAHVSRGEPIHPGDLFGSGTVDIKGKKFQFFLIVCEKGKKVLRVAALGTDLKNSSDFKSFVNSIK